MDSEDEEIYRREQLTGGPRYVYPPCRPGRGQTLELRRYEKEEAEVVLNRYIPVSQREATCQIRPSDRPGDLAAIYRVRRFFATHRGFYKGRLDLTGRHLPRFQSISKRFMEFASDFLFLLKVYGKMGTRKEEDAFGNITQVQDYVFDPVEPYDEFLMKWNCAGSFTPTGFRDYIMENMELVLGPTKPKIQKLCLHHLPPELLVMIMEYLPTKDALHLGSTCRLLREISMPFIHDSLTIQLPFSHALKRILRDTEPSEQCHRLVIYHRVGQEQLIEQLIFLRDHPDFTRKMTDVLVVDRSASELQKYDWDQREESLPPELQVTLQKNEHFIDQLLPAVLSRSPNVHDLQFSSWKITIPILKSLVSMTQLWRLTFFGCRASFDVAAELPSLPSLSAPNLSLNYLDSGEDDVLDLWLVVGACPNLQHLTFGVHTDDYYRISIPLAEITTVVNPFKTLRSIILYNLVPVDVQMLSTWISQVNVPLPLERFKLVVEGGLNRQEILDLLNALASAKLKYLVIDGLRWAEPTLLDQIAQTFPNLESLILQYRESNIQYKCIPAVWPHTSGEYAPHLANFQHLRHFGWNFRENPAYYAGWTYRFFEDGFPEEQELWDPDSKYGDLYRNSFEVDEGILVANVLGAYCPSLEWVSSGKKFGICYARSKGRCFGFEGSLSYTKMSIYDPDSWSRDWEVRSDGSMDCI